MSQFLNSKVVCLNVDKRIQEQKRLLQEFEDVGINLTFFVVGDGHSLPANQYDYIDIQPPSDRYGYPAWANRPNSWNAFAAYKKIIQNAKNNNWEAIGLVEDDCVIQPNFIDTAILIDKELKQLPKWDMLYFCANHTWTPTIQLSQHVLKLNGSGGFQFVLIRNTLYNKFIEMPMICPIDEAAGRYIHPKYNCYATWPNLGIPKGGYSYCEGTNYDNTELYKNKGC